MLRASSTELRQVDLNPVDPTQIPLPVEEYLLKRSGRFTDAPALYPHQFDTLLTAAHPNGVTSYVATHTKQHSSNGRVDGRIDRVLHTVDALPSGDVVGYGEVSLTLNENHPYVVDKPYISWLYTEHRYRKTKQGNLLGRLFVMKAATELEFNLPLYSDAEISDRALRVARRLVKAGMAEEFLDEGRVRFRSIG